MSINENCLTIGVITDGHYADIETMWSRYYRDTLPKVQEATKFFNKTNPDFCVYLGDNVDNGLTPEIELGYLRLIESEYAKFNGIRHYVIGNHDVASFSKEQFLRICGLKKILRCAQNDISCHPERSEGFSYVRENKISHTTREKYYSFDHGLFHFAILDACYNEDESDYDSGNFDWQETYIPKTEQEWLKSDLKKTEKKAIIFAHQRLDDDNGVHGIGNSQIIRQILEDSGKVIAVFQGHDHRGAQSQINGINYFTFQAVVEGQGLENNAYSLIRIEDNGIIKIEGFGKQNSEQWNF